MATTRGISIERVLCPIDFSDASHHALAHAAAIARWHDAQLTVLYVFPYLPALDLPPLPLTDEDRRTLVRLGFSLGQRSALQRWLRRRRLQDAFLDVVLAHLGRFDLR